MMRVWLSAMAVAAMLVAGPAQAETRVALVIGNANYAHAPRLANPVNDAAAVAQALRRVGFTVTTQADLGKSALDLALHDFADTAAGADVAMIYYAGHGMEIAGTNYLIPVDAKLANGRDAAFEAVSLELALHAVEGARRLKLVVLDACRDNPFAAQMADGGRGIGRGLARVEPEGDMLVAYAAKAGTSADDGVGNSPFAAAFARDILTPGLDVRLMFGKVRDDVLAATHHRQEPFVYGSLGGENFYFVLPQGGNVTIGVAPQIDPKAVELALWTSVANSNDAAQLQAYLSKYPNGEFADVARAKIAALARPVQSASPTFLNSPAVSTWIARDDALMMSRVAVVRTANGDRYDFVADSVYPAVDKAGNPQSPATYIEFWMSEADGDKWVELASLKQTQTGSWQPGAAFTARFSVPAYLIDGKNPLNMRLCVGDASRCTPSPNLAPPKAN